MNVEFGAIENILRVEVCGVPEPVRALIKQSAGARAAAHR